MERPVVHAAVVCAVVVALSFAISAQQAPASGRGDRADTLARTIQRSWAEAKRNVAESAEFMPEEHYRYKPTDTVRTFGEILAHLAGANYVFCAAARGEKPPHTEDEFEKSATTRAAINKALTDSLAYCENAFSMFNDARLLDLVAAPFTNSRETRAQVMLGEIGHMNEHYGNLVTYFRMKGLVPPSSRR